MPKTINASYLTKNCNPITYLRPILQRILFNKDLVVENLHQIEDGEDYLAVHWFESLG